MLVEKGTLFFDGEEEENRRIAIVAIRIEKIIYCLRQVASGSGAVLIIISGDTYHILSRDSTGFYELPDDSCKKRFAYFLFEELLSKMMPRFDLIKEKEFVDFVLTD